MISDPKDRLMSTMRFALWTLVLLTSTSSLAAGNVYVVMPTQGVGASAEAALVWQTMRLALEEQSLALVPTSAVEATVAREAAACGQSVVACGRLVGGGTKATHVVVSELWDQAGTFELRVALLDIRTDEAPRWQSVRTAKSAELGSMARDIVLAAVSPDALSGSLSLVAPPGVEIAVDGVVVDRTPLLKPLRLAAGLRVIELRAVGARPLSVSRTVEARSKDTVTVCLDDGGLTEACQKDAGLSAMTIVGGGALALAVVGAGALGGALLMEDAAYKSFDDGSGDGNAIPVWRTTAIVAGVAAGALGVIGVGALITGAVLE